MAPKKPADSNTDDIDDDLDLEEDERKVPYTRFRQAIRRMRQAEARVKDLEAAAEEWETERTTLATERDSLKSQAEEWELERAAMGAGLTDPEGLDLARLAYARLKPEDRPKGGIAGWLKDRDGLPRGVRAYLAAEEGDKGQGKTDPAGKGKTEPPPKDGPRTRAPGNPDAGVRQQPGSAPPLTGREIARMSADEYASHRDSVWQGMGVTPIRRINEKPTST